MAHPLMQESVWLQKQRFEEAEAHFYAVQAGTAQSVQAGTTRSGRVAGTTQSGQASTTPSFKADQEAGVGTLKNQIAQTRQQIQNALNRPAHAVQEGSNPQVQKRLDSLEKENKTLKKTTEDLRILIQKLESRINALEKGGAGEPVTQSKPVSESNQAKPVSEDDDDDFELFGDDDDDAEADAVRQKRLEEYAAKKSKKPALIAKSSVILDVKPWDDETDMAEMERLVRSIQKDGLVWGASKLVDLAYGIKKLQIICVVEDDKISVEDLREDIEKFEDVVQSVDIAAFNKI